MLNTLIHTKIKGYENVLRFKEMTSALGYSNDYWRDKETGLWDVYYCHWKTEKNIIILNIPGEVR